MAEPCLCQGLGHLNVRVWPCRQAPEQLEDQPVVVDKRRVRLFAAEWAGTLSALLSTAGHLQQRHRHFAVGSGAVINPVSYIADQRILVAFQVLGAVEGRALGYNELVLGPSGINYGPQKAGRPR